MLVVRGTQKLRDRVGGHAVDDDATSTGVLGDWFATALFWKPQVALLVNSRTFLPVFTPLAPAKTLLIRVPSEIATILDLHGVDRASVDAEEKEMQPTGIAPTNDRRVVGVMNEFAFLGERFYEGDLRALSLRVARTPVGPLREGGGSPDRALAAMFGSTPPEPAPEADSEPEQLAKVIPFPGPRRTGR